MIPYRDTKSPPCDGPATSKWRIFQVKAENLLLRVGEISMIVFLGILVGIPLLFEFVVAPVVLLWLLWQIL